MADEKKTRPLLEVKDGGVPNRVNLSKFLDGFLDVHGTNFLGSGLTFSDWSMSADFLRYERCYITQTTEEKQRRLGYIIKLSTELERMRQIDLFATRWAEFVIEAIMEGRWDSVRMWVDAMAFKEESPELRTLAAPRFAKFVVIAQEANDTRPKLFCPICRKPPPVDKLGSWEDGRHVCPWCIEVFDEEGNHEPCNRARLHSVEGGG